MTERDMISGVARGRSTGWRWVLVAVAGCLWSLLADASPFLVCSIQQGGKDLELMFRPVSDPYMVEGVDINERFRFKAVVVGDATTVVYVKIYIHAQMDRQRMLLQEAVYRAPQIAATSSQDALTGTHYVYSPRYEYEMRYGCALRDSAS